jgi:hypothetical protein
VPGVMSATVESTALSPVAPAHAGRSRAPVLEGSCFEYHVAQQTELCQPARSVNIPPQKPPIRQRVNAASEPLYFCSTSSCFPGTSRAIEV